MIYRIKYLLPLLALLTFTITCKENLESETPKEKEFVVPKKNYLSREWVSYKQTIVNRENISESTRKQLQSKANAKMRKGIQFYKTKKDLEAIREYEEAIEFYPFTALYYYYGNSLANLNRLEDSVLAYQISLSISGWQYRDELNRPELVMYNLACSYSRLNQLDEAYNYLAQAVDRGYNAFAYVDKDPDMENLRKHPDWKEKIQKWRQEYNYDETAVAGVIREQRPRDALLYYLCKNGIAILFRQDYCQRSKNEIIGYQKGKWLLVSGDIKIDLEESCIPTFKMTDKEEEKYNFMLRMGSGYCKPGIPEFSGNCELKPDTFRHSSLLKRETIKEMVKNPTPSPEEEFNRLSLTRLKESQEPKQCDPDFVPKTLEDITIQEI